MNYRKAADCLDKTKIGILVILGLGATGIMFINAVSRYVFNYSFVWAEEIIRILFVWSMFIAITDSFIRNEHIGFTTISGMNSFTRSFARILNNLCLLIVGGLLAFFGAKYDGMTGEVPLPGTDLPTSVLMWPGIAAGAVWTIVGGGRLVTAFRNFLAGKSESSPEA